MNIKNLDLNLLVAFDALVTERHVTRAAALVGLTQPAMSNALARLRSTLDDRLLVRAGRAMALTVRAQELAGPVHQALHLLSQAIEPRVIARAQSRTFVVGTTEYAEHLLLPQLVQSVMQAAPGARFVIRRLPALFQAPEDELQAGLLDLAVGFFPDVTSLRAGMLSHCLFEDKSVCVVRRGHPAVRSHLSLKQYAALGHVSIFYENDGSSILDRLLVAKRLQRVVALQVPHFSSALHIVAESDLITVVPQRFAIEFGRRLPLRCLPVPLPIPAVKLSMLWHSRGDVDPGLQFVRKQLASISKQSGRTIRKKAEF